LKESQRRSFLASMKKMSKKGFLEVLEYVRDNEGVHYNDVLRHAFDKKIVDSRASITIILNGLTDLDLLERTVTDTRPIRTTYKISRKGSLVVNKLKDLETAFAR
jgi:DNA-binding HxlR family transcriptional regulator